MVQMLLAIFLAGLSGESEDKDKPPKKPVPASPLGMWESQDTNGEFAVGPIRTIEFRDGRMVLVEARDQFQPGKHPGWRIEAEYAIGKTGRVFGYVTSVFGATTASEGDTFSFVPTHEDGALVMHYLKGCQPLQVFRDGVAWKRKQ